MRKKRAIIYRSRWHLLATFLLIVGPFLFLILFSRVSHIRVNDLMFDLFVSSWRLLVAYFIAAILAWVWALSFYRGKRAAIALPIFDVLQSFPTFAILPFAIRLWGGSDTTVIFFLVVTIIWPIFFSMISSLKLIKNDWEEATEIMGLRGLDYLRYFLLPISIPGLITGSVIGLGEAWEALVATEIIVNINVGLGSFFAAYSSNASVTILGILGLLIVIFSINKLIWIPLLEYSHERMDE